MTRVVRIEVPTPYYVGPVNAWLLRGEACVLIDVGVRTPEARETLRAGLRKEGVAFRDIQAVLLTHGHPDHFGLAREIRDESGARVYAHEADRKLVEGYPATHRRILEGFSEIASTHGFPPDRFDDAVAEYRSKGEIAESAPVDRALADGETLEFGSLRLTAIHTPGHSNGSVCYHGGARIFCGDTVLERITPITFFKGRRSRMGPGEFRRSIKRLKSLEVRMAYPGHRPKFADFAGAVSRIERHLELRTRRVLGAIEGEKTAWELSTVAFPKEHVARRWVSFAETLGHLEELEAAGAIRSTEGRPVRWRRV